jgi:nucleoside-diphosphate-sugar epimerase
MKLFVTGGTGFIGSHFLNVAIDAGHEVIAIRREGATPRVPLLQQPHWITATLKDAGEIFLKDESLEIDAVVHLAATGVLPKDQNWSDCYQTNVTDSLEVWQSALEAGVRRIVSCGSCFEYGASALRYERIPVTCPLEPSGPYASSKAAATVSLTGLTREKKTEAVLVRPFQVYGEGECEGRFWPELRAAALSGADFAMTAGEQIRDFVPVERVADRILRLAVGDKVEPGQTLIVNIGSGVPEKLKDFASRMWTKWQAKGELLLGALPYRKDEVMRYVPELDESLCDFFVD